jgi:putative endonuclease
MTNNLERRIHGHKRDLDEGFKKRYGVHRLVHYEYSRDAYAAIQRQKRIKKWRRRWKPELIEKHNPEWTHLCSKDGTIPPLPRE